MTNTIPPFFPSPESSEYESEEDFWMVDPNRTNVYCELALEEEEEPLDDEK